MLSNAKKLTAATALTGAAVLTFGLAGPAFANGSVADANKTPNQAPQHVAPTLAQVQAWMTKRIDHRLARLAKVQAAVAASTTMTAAQKADATTRLAARVTALLALKSSVAAATTTAEIEAAVKVYALTGGKLFWGDRLGEFMVGTFGHKDADDKHGVVAKKLGQTKKPVTKPGQRHPVTVVARPGSATSTAFGNRIAVRNSSNGHRFTGSWVGHVDGHGGWFSHGGPLHN